MTDERSDMSGHEENRSDPDIISSSSCSTCLDGADQVLENVLENVLHFLTARGDRNAASLVCKSWYRAEALTRSDLFIGNCYAVSPRRAVERFRRVRSVELKGKPRFSDFGLVPLNWGAHFAPWVAAMADAYPGLERIYLKRMSVTDEDLAVIASSFAGFKELVLICCEGFSTRGLAVIASKCRQLRVLDLIEDVMDDDEDVDWLSCFPDSGTCLESLSFDCVECQVNFEALEALVVRSPSLKKLRLNRNISVAQLQRLMHRAPQLTHLGTGSFSSTDPVQGEQEVDLHSAFGTCRSLVCLSGFRDVVPDYLPAIVPVCANLVSLNFSYGNITSEQLRTVILHCHRLQVFWALDSIRDEGLQAVAATCKDLRELRIFPVDPQEDSEALVSEVGLVAISEGCRKLRSILYFCQHMTNVAVVTMSMNCQELVVFRLCIMGRHQPDHLTGEAMDEGFGAIVRNCKKLTRLATSGLLTDKAFAYIGRYGKLVRTLSVAFAGDSDLGLRHVLEGCPKLQKLEIRDSPFGDPALLSGLHHYYNMRFLWMSSCRLSLRGCKEVAQRLPRLVVEVIRDHEEGFEESVEKLYLYRSLAGPRNDAPTFVSIL
ncbi:transport inhibitor response 1-like protein [Cinnamomum micranthum f. kanehirae]|uniref:Transport inhibitor response 1-like protein n=1 Tax=Cinnamomum micranthum f. kanehirae TaxID=337451 RepID=A0A443NLC2_9MAGN|nr:transport inhibitor response 1-like protein [Cinnamomum micranthum f. kanehirae]